MKYAIIKNDYPESLELFEKLQNELQNDSQWDYDEKNPEYVFVIGGDGTFLQATNKYNNQLNQVKFYPIKKGGIGFYTNHNIFDDNKPLKDMICLSNCKIQNFNLLEVLIDNKKHYVINELKILNDVSPKDLEVSIDDEILETFKGSGLAFATPTGTTGFMKSAGGAIIFPTDLKVFEMQELSPVSTVIFKTINAPIIFDKQVITIQNKNKLKPNKNTRIIADAQIIAESFETIKIKLSQTQLQIVSTSSVNRIKLLRDIFVINN